MYDVVWYTPERVKDVDKILARLPIEECLARHVPGDVVMSSPGVMLPIQGLQGRAVCRHILGANEIPLGNTKVMESICVLTEHGTGLVGGTFLADFLLSPEMEEAEQRAEEREAMLRARIPWRFGKCLRYTWLSVIGLAASVILCLRSIPHSLKPSPRRRVRPVHELEHDFARVYGSVVRQRSANGR